MTDFDVRTGAWPSWLVLAIVGLLAACGGKTDPSDVVEKGKALVEELSTTTSWTCDPQTDLPGDIPGTLASATQTILDQWSWDTFNAINASTIQGSVANSQPSDGTLWDGFSSTVAFIENQGGTFGDRYYPDACTSVPSYTNYRVIAQVDKINDSVQEASNISAGDGITSSANHHQGVGLGSPLINRMGKFTRYEIVMNEVEFDYVKGLKLWNQAGLAALTADLDFPEATNDPNNGDPSNANTGSMVVKLAWMPLDGFSDAEKATFHTEDLLVFDDGENRSDGQDSCSVQTMGLVGMHLVRKTAKQPLWTWATFEHVNNNPDCWQVPDGGDGNGDHGPATSCPQDYGTNVYNFNPGAGCATAGTCDACNTDPQQNCSGQSTTGWCVDETVSPVAQLCRQVSNTGNTGHGGYPTKTVNDTCHTSLANSVWKNYELISTQWNVAKTGGGTPAPTDMPGTQVPTITMTTTATSGSTSVATATAQGEFSAGKIEGRPYLANTTMESYERSNCNKCHSGARVDSTDNPSQFSTDFAYWVAIEVPCGPGDTAPSKCSD